MHVRWIAGAEWHRQKKMRRSCCYARPPWVPPLPFIDRTSAHPAGSLQSRLHYSAVCMEGHGSEARAQIHVTTFVWRGVRKGLAELWRGIGCGPCGDPDARDCARPGRQHDFMWQRHIGADLSGAKNLIQTQLNEASGNNETELPEGLGLTLLKPCPPIT